MTEPEHQRLEIAGYSGLRKIAEGGMGEVYEAWQEGPVHRRVAIKLIKRGMDSDDVVARFESERQSLALMNNPHIAQVYSAGTTPAGRPYFVMEYVDGLPMAEHCDRERLGLDERIALFLQACEGVHHAHQKGIIHRDIKSSNVLVETQDGRASPKIIDFGLAKALSRSSFDATGLTQTGSPIGTPEYMSPEQLELAGTSVDTRADVYALGVLLYELLVGSRPFDARVISESGFFEFRRQILEVDAPAPSTRAREDAAASRRTTAAQLHKLVSGDLDWIVGRALEKQPDRRYPAVSELAADLRRHLNDEPVLASPPSRTYRIRKFARRHKLGVVSAVAILVALGLGFAGTSLALARAVDAEGLASREAGRAGDEARAARAAEAVAQREAARATQEAKTARQTSDFMVGLFEVVDPGEARGNTVTAREMLDRGAQRIQAELRDEPEVRASLMGTMGVVYSRLGLYPAALPLLREALEARRRALGDEDVRVAESHHELGAALRKTADYAGAERELLVALDMRQRLLGEHAATAETLNELAANMIDLGRWSEAEELSCEALEMRRKLLGRSAAVAASLDVMAFALYGQKKTDGVEMLLREELELYTEFLGTHPDTAAALSNLGTFLYENKRRGEAIPLFRESLDMKRKLFGAVHPELALSMNNLAFVLHDTGDLDGAEQLYRATIEQQLMLLGDAHPDLGQTLNNLAFVLYDRADFDGARECFFEAITVYRRALGDEHASVRNAVTNAKQAVTSYIERRKRELGPEHAETVSARLDLADLWLVAGRPDDAEPLAGEILDSLHEDSDAQSVLRLRALSVRGAVLSSHGELREAETLLQASFVGLQKALGPDANAVRTTGERLAVLYDATDRHQQAAATRAHLKPGITGR